MNQSKRYPSKMKEQARTMRVSGKSTRIIAMELRVSRGAVLGWLKERKVPLRKRRAKCEHSSTAGTVVPDLRSISKNLLSSDLTVREQAHLRTALRFVKTRSGTCGRLASMLRINRQYLHSMKLGIRLAVRLARVAGVPIDDVLSGRYPPPGACPHCGKIVQKPDQIVESGKS